MAETVLKFVHHVAACAFCSPLFSIDTKVNIKAYGPLRIVFAGMFGA